MKTKRLTIYTVALLMLFMSRQSWSAEDEKRPPRTDFQPRPEAMYAPEPRPGISNNHAASLVKQRYSSARILGVSLLDQGGAPIYKVRTLSENGVVRSVFVDGRSGEVFE